MIPTIKFFIIKRFGKIQYHPACDISSALCEISKKRSLTASDVGMLESLDIFKFEIAENEK